MQIGNIYTATRTVKKEGEDVNQEWLEMTIRPPFMASATFSVHPNKNKKGASEPDFNIWYNYCRKNERFKGTKVGAIWRKKSSDKKTDYFSGHIENPLVYGGKMYITAFKAKPMNNEKAEDINWLYDVVWQPPKGNNNSNNHSGGYVAPTTYTQTNDVEIEQSDTGIDPMSEEYFVHS